VNVNVNLKMLLLPAPQKFTTFNTFNTFAKFANFDPALEHPTLLRRHAPRRGSISERAVSTHPPSPGSTGRVPTKWVAGRGVRAVRG
jgi:hypothetical protein